MSDKVTSVSLLARLRAPADDDAWRTFNDLYRPLIRHWLVRRGVNAHDADDVGQEVMELAIVELPKFEHNGRTGAFRCWLRQVVSNRLKSHWRRANRHRPPGGGPDYAAMAEAMEDPHSELSRIWDEEYQRYVCQRLLDSVASEFRMQTMEAFRRVALEGQEPANVARDLEMSVNAVRIAQSRVLARLREVGQEIME